MTAFIVGLVIALNVLGLRYILWKDNVPIKVVEFKWLIAFVLGILSLLIIYLLEGKIENTIFSVGVVAITGKLLENGSYDTD